MPAFDVLVRNAFVVDGSGAPGRRADVGVLDGLITAVGTVPEGAVAQSEVEASGLTLAPGFIDVHTHSDVTLLGPDAGINKICQGVTTEMTGNCGFSAFPVTQSRAQLHSDHLAYLGPDVAELRWSDFDGYARAVQAAGPVQNVACLVGHGALRIAVAGNTDARLDEGQSSQICSLLATSLEQGAFGFSTGLTYVPSMFGSLPELTMLGEVAARFGAVYATHARAFAGRERDAIAEAIDVGRGSGVRVEFSHLAINDPRLWGTAAASLALFDEARAAGTDVQFDVYPYDASASSIAQYLPSWLTSEGPASRRMLADPEVRSRAFAELAQGWFGGIPWMWDRVLVTQSGPDDHETPGHTIEQLAVAWSCDPPEVALRLYESHGNALQVALFYRTEEDMVEFLRHPASIVGSDGIAMAKRSLGEKPHPRFYGTFPRVLGRYVRDKGVLSLEEAVRKMSGEPADRFRVSKRGYVKPGYAADLVIFSAEEVEDRASFAEPNRLPIGIDKVYVNGRLVVDSGSWNGQSGGEVLRLGND
ncbi:MAG TPA: D-aminoacylase [Acidimicrobiales bacterium]|nr:D-aminoacylase [Acidimicrobiales bacterium]